MVIRDVLNAYPITDLILHLSSRAALKPGETKTYPVPPHPLGQPGWRPARVTKPLPFLLRALWSSYCAKMSSVCKITMKTSPSTITPVCKWISSPGSDCNNEEWGNGKGNSSWDPLSKQPAVFSNTGLTWCISPKELTQLPELP